MTRKRKEHIPQLNEEIASRILEEAFKANEREPNSVPLSVLISYSNYRKERFTLQKTVLMVIMTCFLLLPLLFIPPNFTVSSLSDHYEAHPQYRVDVDSLMLVERLTASINGRNIPVYEVDSHVYSIEPTQNGPMKITVTLINRQTQTEYIDVSNVDMDIPVITSNYLKKGDLYLHLSDDRSGVDFDNITASTPDGQEILPTKVDAEEGFIAFSRPIENLNIYIPDYAGNMLHIIVTVE